MKQRVVFAILIIVMLLGSVTVWCQVEPEEGYGKVIGYVVDSDTGEPCKERFHVYFYFLDKTQTKAGIEKFTTDQNGYIEKKLKPDLYYPQVSPVSENSEYCGTPHPTKLRKEGRRTIKVEKGQITFFQLKAVVGGRLTFYISDLNGVRFNPKEKFGKEFLITAQVSGNNSSMETRYATDTLNDGELRFRSSYPGIYKAKVEFDGIGYSTIILENILIEKGKTTEKLIKIDLNDNTGVEGIITDANGSPMHGVEICFVREDEQDSKLYCTTSEQNGHYSLSGMPPGEYTYSIDSPITIFSEDVYSIAKGVALRLDVQLAFSKTGK